MTHWVFPITTVEKLKKQNEKGLDVINAFKSIGIVDWTLNNKIEIGDEIYIYAGEPVYKIVLKAVMIQDDITEEEMIDDSDFMINKDIQTSEQKNKPNEKTIRLKLVRIFSETTSNKLSLELLRMNGFRNKNSSKKKNIQDKCRLNAYNGLLEYVKSIESQEKLEMENEIKIIESNYINGLTKTERSQIIKIRIGQSKFRERLINLDKCCKICGLKNKDLLIASHIKDWSKCRESEKLDVDNGLLLCSSHDVLFDKKYISFEDNGVIILSSLVDYEIKKAFNINENTKIEIREGNKKYLKWHRKELEKKQSQ